MHLSPDWDNREAALEALVLAEREFAGSFDEAAVRRALREVYARTPRRSRQRSPLSRWANTVHMWLTPEALRQVGALRRGIQAPTRNLTWMQADPHPASPSVLTLAMSPTTYAHCK